MQLLDWLEQLWQLKQDPGDVSVEALEQSIAVLRARTFVIVQPEGYDDHMEEMRETLLEITEDLEDFLESGDFRMVQAACLRARKLDDLEQCLYDEEYALPLF